MPPLRNSMDFQTRRLRRGLFEPVACSWPAPPSPARATLNPPKPNRSSKSGCGAAPRTGYLDPKPAAGYDYCGPFTKPIPTNVSGMEINELLPLLARQADKYSIIRSMTHGVYGSRNRVLHGPDRAQAGRTPALSVRRLRGLAAPGLPTPDIAD